MKVTGLNGKGVGKLGMEVYSINHGVQIRRAYNSEVSNPSTGAQVGQRARFKLASQVSAALAPVIAIPRDGLQSPRNIFTKINMPFFYGTVDGAAVTYENLQITQGAIGLPRVRVLRGTNNRVGFQVEGWVDTFVDKLVFCLFTKNDEGSLQYLYSYVCSPNVRESQSSVNLPYISDYYAAASTPLIVFAYGFRLNSDRARARYFNYSVKTGEDMARLIANRSLDASDVTFTVTRGTSLAANVEESVEVPEGSAIVYFSNVGPGDVALKVGQTTNASSPQVVTIGTNVILSATPWGENNGARGKFLGWYENGSSVLLSTSQSYPFTVDGTRDVIGKFVWENYSSSLE